MNDVISCEAEGTGKITADWAVPSSLERADDGQRVCDPPYDLVLADGTFSEGRSPSLRRSLGGWDRLASTIYSLRRLVSGIDG